MSQLLDFALQLFTIDSVVICNDNSSSVHAIYLLCEKWLQKPTFP